MKCDFNKVKQYFSYYTYKLFIAPEIPNDVIKYNDE